MDIDSGRALDEKLVLNLKRAHNSLSKINKLPIELLGDIFHWNVMIKDDFGGLDEGSHNFLLVCHHWFEVASCTPQLWSFWGNNPRDWARLYSRSTTAPLDLVLGAPESADHKHFGDALINTLRDRARRNTIRRVHLCYTETPFVETIISLLTPDGGEVRSSRMESLILWNWDYGISQVDMSDFFAGRCFPKLQRLDLNNYKISSWDALISGTGALTDLSLSFSYSSPKPRLLHILASNPLLRKVSLSLDVAPDEDCDSFPRVPLHHLRHLELIGDSRHVLKLLDRLDHPQILDNFLLTLNKCSAWEISQILGPYFLRYFRDCGRSQSGSGLVLSSQHNIELNGFGIDPGFLSKDKSLTINPDNGIPNEVREKAVLDFIGHIPLEKLTNFGTFYRSFPTDCVYTRFPNLSTLVLFGVDLSVTFPELSSGWNKDILPNLQNLVLVRPTGYGGDWSPLTTFLAVRASSGKRLRNIKILYLGYSNMDQRVVESIKRVVEEFDASRDLIDNTPGFF